MFGSVPCAHGVFQLPVPGVVAPGAPAAANDPDSDCDLPAGDGTLPNACGFPQSLLGLANGAGGAPQSPPVLARLDGCPQSLPVLAFAGGMPQSPPFVGGFQMFGLGSGGGGVLQSLAAGAVGDDQTDGAGA